MTTVSNIQNAKPFTDEKNGNYDIGGTCTLDGHVCVYKQCITFGFSHIIEVEASRILRSSHNFCKVIKTVVSPSNVQHVITEAIVGLPLDMFLKTCSDQELLSQFAQTLMAIELMNIADISHNDLNISNIIVAKTDSKLATFSICGILYTIPTFGYLPIIINFGLANIKGCRWKPSFIDNLPMNLGYSLNDVRFDFFKFVNDFVNNLRNESRMDSFIRFMQRTIIYKASLDSFGLPSVDFMSLKIGWTTWLNLNYKTTNIDGIDMSVNTLRLLLSWGDRDVVNTHKDVIKTHIAFLSNSIRLDSGIPGKFELKVKEAVSNPEKDSEFYTSLASLAQLFTKSFLPGYIQEGKQKLLYWDSIEFQSPLNLAKIIIAQFSDVSLRS